MWDSGTPTHTGGVCQSSQTCPKNGKSTFFFGHMSHTCDTKNWATGHTSSLVFFGLFSLETRESRPLFFTLVARPTTTHALRRSSQPVIDDTRCKRTRTHYACCPSSRLRNTPKCGKLCALSHRLLELFAGDLFAHGPQKGRFECQGLPARHPFSSHSSIK